MKSLLKILFIFLAITGATSLLIQFTDINFGKTDFFEIHGWFFLISIAIFPRLTLLFSSVPFGGILWWVGFFIAPRFLVALLATTAYWNTNPILVTIAWLVASSGESSEKYMISRGRFFGFGRPNVHVRFKQNQPPHQQPQSGDVFEAEYKVKE